ncbi:MAG: site-specific DNA-methyltransferase, partial [Campylobacterota bacterium]|nr:site-specific DNA-methyltransferase [Campylobacterota bacterium]
MNEKLNELKHILKDMFQMNNSDLDFGIYRIMNMKNCQIMEFFDTKLNSIQLAPKEQDIIYSNMIEFFSRYYQDGDFISQRRYSDKNSYAIPYNGEEVKLHWANADQYYIKTGEYFKNYTFKTKYATVDFKVNEADSSKDNNKSEKRYF